MKHFIKEFISKTSLNAYFCHAGLSGIFLQEGFPTSGNDIQVALLMTVLVNEAISSLTNEIATHPSCARNDRQISRLLLLSLDLGP